MRISRTEPQKRFIESKAQFPAFVGGFGSGKTEALLNRCLKFKTSYPRQSVAFYEPTYDLVRMIAWPRFEEKLEKLKLPYRLIKSPHNVLEIQDFGSIIFRSMDTPGRIVGYEVADSFVDELDTMKRDDAAHSWRQIIARNRQKKPDGSLNTASVATTPEGYRFVYEQWEKLKTPGYELVRAPTRSNPFLPPGYIESLQSSYPSQLLIAYLDGFFTNLTAGSVYFEFDRKLNASWEEIKPNEDLHVGVDFNVGKMVAIVHVLRDQDPHAVKEFTGVLDTPAMIALLKERYKDKGHRIFIYPDASGKSRKSVNASESDLALFRAAGFNVLVNASNPAVKDRVLSMNGMIHNSGKRRYRVHPDNCPLLVESLEKQAYDKNGEPDKSSDLDHPVDAAGYFINYRYPIKSNQIFTAQIRGT